MPLELRTFFESYRESFNALDGGAVAELYAEPSGIASDTGYVHWPTRDLVRQNMVALCALYQANGLASVKFEPAAFIDQGHQFCVVDLMWEIEWREKPPSRFGTTYNMIRTIDGWRVLLCTEYSEQKLNK